MGSIRGAWAVPTGLVISQTVREDIKPTRMTREQDIRYTTLTQEQGQMIVDRLVQLNGAIITRLCDAGIEAGVVMGISIGGQDEKKCRCPFISYGTVMGKDSPVSDAMDSMLRTSESKSLKGKKENAAILHLLDHLGGGNKDGAITDFDLTAILTSIVSDEEKAHMEKVNTIFIPVPGEEMP